MPLKLLHLVAAETGYSEKALRRKIEDGILIEGKHYYRSPDGRISIDTEEFTKWQKGETQSASAR